MKTRLSIFIVCLSFLGLAQPKLSVLPNYTVSPASALTATPGISYNDTIQISCLVSNKGTTTFSVGSVTLLRTVKSGTFTSTVASLGTFFIPSLAPGDSTLVVARDTVKPSSYRIDGNGNTIVVWPMAPNTIIKDSLHAGPIYVNNLTGIKELDRYRLFIFPNPVSRLVYIKPASNVRYQELIVYDMQLRVVMRKPFEEENDLGDLAPGSYILSVSDTEGRRYSSRFVKQ